jgi:hypothetical protein
VLHVIPLLDVVQMSLSMVLPAAAPPAITQCSSDVQTAADTAVSTTGSCIPSHDSPAVVVMSTADDVVAAQTEADEHVMVSI